MGGDAFIGFTPFVGNLPLTPWLLRESRSTDVLLENIYSDPARCKEEPGYCALENLVPIEGENKMDFNEHPQRISLHEVVEDIGKNFGLPPGQFWIHATPMRLRCRIGESYVSRLNLEPTIRMLMWGLAISAPIGLLVLALSLGWWALLWAPLLWVVSGGLVVWLNSQLPEMFDSKVKTELGICRGQATKLPDMATKAITALWATRDTRPLFGGVKKWSAVLTLGSQGNSVDLDVCRPILSALELLATASDAAQKVQDGTRVGFTMNLAFDDAIELAEGSVEAAKANWNLIVKPAVWSVRPVLWLLRKALSVLWWSLRKSVLVAMVSAALWVIATFGPSVIKLIEELLAI